MKHFKLPFLMATVFCVVFLCACNSAGSGGTMRTINDSLGRTVPIPNEVNKVIPSGQLAQIFLLSVCPDKMVAVASNWNDEAMEFLPSSVADLPCIGQVFGGKKNFNPESVLSVGADVIIDVGDYKDGMEEELDDIEKQLGIPVIHLDGSLENMPESYRILGSLVGMNDEAENRAKYCEDMNKKMKELSGAVAKKDALLITGEQGLNVIPEGSKQGESFNMFANNLAVVDNPTDKGSGNEVDMEQILSWNPDVIIFLPDVTPREVFNDGLWQEVNAVKSGAVYGIPHGPYNWLGFPSSVQKYLGMMWMADLLYPDNTDYDLYEEVKDYYKLFYGYDLSQDKYNELVAR